MSDLPLFAVDVGSGLTKFRHRQDRRHVKSVVTPPNAQGGAYDIEKALPIRWDSGAGFFVDVDARRFGDLTKVADTCTPSWAGSDEWLALLYFALAKLGAE